MSDDMMTIRAMCEAFDVTPRTLRFYEQKELLFPTRLGQRRLYGKRDRARMKLILRGRKFGVSLEEIRRLLDLYEMGEHPHLQLLSSLDTAYRRRAEMIEQRDALAATITELVALITAGEALASAQGLTPGKVPDAANAA